MASADAPCTHCGAVFPIAQMLRLDAQGEYVFTCQDCAVEAPTGKGPESRRAVARRKR